MATIDDLKDSISKLPTDELFGLLRASRQNRRTNKRPKKTSDTRKKKELDIDSLLGKMSDEQREQLMTQLEEKP